MTNILKFKIKSRAPRSKRAKNFTATEKKKSFFPKIIGFQRYFSVFMFLVPVLKMMSSKFLKYLFIEMLYGGGCIGGGERHRPPPHPSIRLTLTIVYHCFYVTSFFCFFIKILFELAYIEFQISGILENNSIFGWFRFKIDYFRNSWLIQFGELS